MHKTSNSETEVITILCSRSVGFSIFADFTLNIGAKALNLNRNLFQSFSGWSSAFAEKLLEPGQSAERLSFTDLSKCRSLRSGFVLFGLFLFAQHRRLQDRSDMRFAEQAYAARKLDWLIAQFGDEVRPLLAEMEDAPGMRAVEARQLRELLDKMERASKLPSGKACRNAAHRDVDNFLLRLIGFVSGHRDPLRPIHLDMASRSTRWLVPILLGHGPERSIRSILSWARIAEWAATGIAVSRSVEVLYAIYKEKRMSPWINVQRHAWYHLS